MIERAGVTLAGVDAALRRLLDGSYGRCARCDAPLGAAALEHDPLLAECEDCASGRAGDDRQDGRVVTVPEAADTVPEAADDPAR